MTENYEQEHLIREGETVYSTEDLAKKENYRLRLMEYLKNPEFRAIEGFPIGTDEGILALSDPPYYTACPNPFLPEIMAEWKQEREELRQKLGLKEDGYQREPFATDVSEGKNDPIYNAHSYHTKVPHKAIMRYILHYTDPGDIVFDGFCGTGMTGVAAQLCGDKKAVEELGYRVDEQGVIWDGNLAISCLGLRKAVLIDLSPAATFISYNYNTPINALTFERASKTILKEAEYECGWVYKTSEKKNETNGRINFTVWSDIYLCPHCGEEMIFWDVAVDHANGKIRDVWNCPQCSTLLAKNPAKKSGAQKIEHAWETIYDHSLRTTIRRIKQIPTSINYSVGSKRYEKKPDKGDFALIQKIDDTEIVNRFPHSRMPEGDESRRNDDIGITHIHQFFIRANLLTMANLWNKIQEVKNQRIKLALILVFTAIIPYASRLRRFRPDKKGGGPLSGTLYIASLITPPNVLLSYARNVKFINNAFNELKTITSPSVISTGSASQLGNLRSDILDYIFVDPPFGSNIMYSELNYLWEAWLGVVTDNNPEAIINHEQRKELPEYQKLMEQCFREFYRILKPGRWMTIEFHNSQNSVWNSIQEGLQRVGFVIADVRVLDKQQETFKQSNTTSAVKKDLIISAYKPNGNLDEKFRLKAGSIDGVWEFVRYHLGKLPVTNLANGNAAVNAERQAFLLFDRMVAFHIQRGVMVPISSPEFYAGLDQHFITRDGMYFLPDQVAEYDRAALISGKPTQIPMFVNDEKTAITWLRQILDPAYGGEPKTRGDLTNPFNQNMHRVKHESPLELIEILEQNFLQDEEGAWYVPDHNKATDLDKIRQHSLLKEFNEYIEGTSRLRQFRTEAVRAGFGDCWKKSDYTRIIKVAERLPEAVLREDPDLLMYYDNATLRMR